MDFQTFEIGGKWNTERLTCVTKIKKMSTRRIGCLLAPTGPTFVQIVVGRVHSATTRQSLGQTHYHKERRVRAWVIRNGLRLLWILVSGGTARRASKNPTIFFSFFLASSGDESFLNLTFVEKMRLMASIKFSFSRGS